MNFPEPVIGIAIEPKTQADVDKLGMALSKSYLKKILLSVLKLMKIQDKLSSAGMGELHLDIIVDRLQTRV
jgi:elongation factor G